MNNFSIVKSLLLPRQARSLYNLKCGPQNQLVRKYATQNVAQLQSIKFDRLLMKDKSEIMRLRHVCENDGFLYLDFRSTQGQHMLDNYARIFGLMNDWFQRPLSDKMRYHRGTVLHGYTPVGTYAGVFDNTRDGNETIKITDEAMKSKLPVLPDLYFDNQTLFDQFIKDSRQVTKDLLVSLSDAMGLQGKDRFENYHRTDMPANCCLNLFCYPKRSETDSRFGQNKHTDNGTLTMLFAEEPGLEMLSPTTGIWGQVLPKAGHAVINVGDTLRFLSGYKFASAIHRVIPRFKPEQQNRFAIGYFLRAEDNATVTDDGGRVMTARQWHDQKYSNYKATHDKQQENTILTGGMEGVILNKESVQPMNA